MVKFVIASPELQWSKIKVGMMKRDILVMLRQAGAGNCTWVEEWDGQKSAPPPPPVYIHLQCKDCAISWFNEQFTICPGCQEKATVSKGTMKRIPLPEGVRLMQILPDCNETDDLIKAARQHGQKMINAQMAPLSTYDAASGT
jgi:hypothetical protein